MYSNKICATGGLTKIFVLLEGLRRFFVSSKKNLKMCATPGHTKFCVGWRTTICVIMQGVRYVC